ncbi:MAG: hypothetical protein QOG54_417 [Actinomycetota bacterium]|jgi:hypothetical protein|nr:hypothetical protein [Actinomycetota bacterium]
MPGVVSAAPGPKLSVNVAAGRHPISPDIYGLNFAPEKLAGQIGLPVDRWGGDSTETYNWRINSANQGLNWYFENFPDCWIPRFNYCETGHNFSAAQDRIEIDRRVGAKTILNLPMLGWVAKDFSYDNEGSCSFPAGVYDPQDDHDPFHDVCGNGMRNGRFITSPAVDKTRAGAPADADFNAAWVDDLVGRYGDAAHGGVAIYELGNEPGLWSETHFDFHPQPLSYDELWQKSRELATAVKQADPTAAVLGPAEWGWPNYFCSPADVPDNGCNASSPDRAAHGGTELSAWYLRQFKNYEQQNGKRLLDYFDLHYYPQATYDGNRYQPATDVTRPLWDRDYKDPSWIDSKIYLIPRMRAWVADEYPGTKLSITEYNMGLGVTKDKRLQAIFEADALGIFGREGLDLATFWPQQGSPVPAAAFKAYLNYDGNHSTFGDVAVQSTSTDQGKLAIYAAQRGESGPLTIMVINKAKGALSSPVDLSGFAPASPAEVYRYTGGKIEKQRDKSVNSSGFSMSYPARSITLIVVPPA